VDPNLRASVSVEGDDMPGLGSNEKQVLDAGGGVHGAQISRCAIGNSRQGDLKQTLQVVDIARPNRGFPGVVATMLGVEIKLGPIIGRCSRASRSRQGRQPGIGTTPRT
jgi:hypothetical protein